MAKYSKDEIYFENTHREFDDGRYKKESLAQREAFEYYYSLGENRDLQQVAEHTGKAYRTVLEWSRRFGWQERVMQYDIEASKKLREKTIKSVVEEKANYRKLIKAMIGQLAKDFTNGEVKATSVLDLERLIKLDMMLLGEATEIKKVDQTNALTEQDREAVMKLAEGLIKESDAILDDE